MLPRTFLPMRAVVVAVLCALALVAVGATSPISAAADDLDTARARLEELQANLDSVADRYLEARDRLVVLNQRINFRARQVQKRARALLGFEKDAEALAIELYKGGNSIGAIEGMLSSENMAELNRTTAYLEFSGEDQQRVIERIANDTADLEHELDLMDREREQAQAAVEELDAIKESVAADTAAVEDEIGRLEEEAAAERAAELAAEREAALAAAAQATETIEANPAPDTSAPVPPPSTEADWEAIAMCESGGNWHIDSTYDGGLQFHPNTWLGYGGGRYARYAWQATKEQQIAIAERVLDAQGPGAWPNCFQWK